MLVVQFHQHADLHEMLCGTGDRRIVFVSHSDRFLGSGCDAEALAEAKTYRGKNWLGKTLMKLRQRLQVTVLYRFLTFSLFKFGNYE